MRPIFPKNGIAIDPVVDFHAILHARTAPPLHQKAQAIALLRGTVSGQDLLKVFDGVLVNRNHVMN